MNDLRTPIGWFFSVIGVIVIAAGLAMAPDRAILTTVNVDLYCGIAMLVFGSVMLWLARRAS